MCIFKLDLSKVGLPGGLASVQPILVQTLKLQHHTVKKNLPLPVCDMMPPCVKCQALKSAETINYYNFQQIRAVIFTDETMEIS